MPRPKKNVKDRAQVVSVTIPPAILRKSQNKAFMNNLSYSKYIVNLIEEDFASEKIDKLIKKIEEHTKENGC